LTGACFMGWPRRRLSLAAVLEDMCLVAVHDDILNGFLSHLRFRDLHQRRSGGFWRGTQETKRRRALFNAETDAETT